MTCFNTDETSRVAYIFFKAKQQNVASGEDLRQSELSPGELIYECGKNDFAVFKDNDGEVTCRSYSSGNPTPAFQVNMRRLFSLYVAPSGWRSA